MGYGKRNVINLDMLHYNIGLLGESGIGKTTLIKNVIEKYTNNPDAALFLETSLESGADCINGINYLNCLEWDEEYDEYTNTIGVKTVCEDIIENKTTEYPNLKVVVIDTIDQLMSLAEKETIRLWNKECTEKGHPEKKAKTIKQAWNGFNVPTDFALNLIFDIITKLRKVGVATIIIGHVKTKNIDDTASGQSYQSLTSDLQKPYFNAIKKNLHFLGLAYIDRNIIKEKTGKKNIVTGKEEIVGKVKSEVRKIRFRDDGYAIDCKCRFADIIPEINFDADEFISAIENAIKAEQAKSGVPIDKISAEQKSIEEKKAKRVAQAEKEKKIQKELDKVVSELLDFFTENKTNIEIIKPIMAKCRELGYNNPKEITNIEDAKALLSMTLK